VESRRIFVVEPDEVIRSALYFILRDDHETHAFASLEQALIKAPDCKPDVVLLGVDTLEAGGERILADPSFCFPHAGILLVANSADDPLALIGLKQGAHDVISKPISFDSVRDKVDGMFGHGRISLPRPASAVM
jgi:DNA-binding NtrC family response regulator